MFPPRNPRMKEYVRQDANNRDVTGTNVWRLKRPRTGNWREVTDGDTCCFAFTSLSYTPADVTDDTFVLRILCDATTLITLTVSQEDPTTDIDGVVDLLNDKAGYLGTFSVNGSDIDFKLKQDIANDLNCDGDISFTVLTS